MRASFQTLALFGLAAVNAAPMPQATNTDYSQLWNQQLKSMESVQNAMAKPTGGASAAPSATGSAGDKTTVIPSVVHMTSTVTAGASASAPAPSETGGASPSAAAASSAAAPSGSSSSSGGGAGSGATVTNQQAFQNGAATKSVNTAQGSSNVQDGQYKCYSGGPSGYPSSDKWGSFDALWKINQKLLSEACTNLGDGADDTQQQIGYIHDGILEVAKDSFVDPRFILAVIMQESHGCVNVGTTSNGVSNPGIMQSHNGVSFNPSQPQQSIVQMIRDGVQGTSSGDGLVQLINKYGDVFSASRGYNSGTVTQNQLNAGNGATASYVTDIANRLLGWSLNPGTSPTNCPGESGA